jgi:hypothetical protein
MGWTVHPEVIQLLEWLALMLLSFILGILVERNRQANIELANRKERLKKAIEEHLANQVRL